MGIQTGGKANLEKASKREHEHSVELKQNKHKSKEISKMKLNELSEIVEILAIKLGIADKDGIVG